MELMNRFVKDEKGQGLAEYGLILLSVAIGLITLLTALGMIISGWYESAASLW